MLPQVEFAYNASRALVTEANFGFSLEEPHDLLFSMRLSISHSQDASKRVKLLHDVHTLVRFVLKVHKDEMHERSEPSTCPHFVKGDKV
jgi:hypothetical protein